jgi:DNA-binding NarL/FixJ family response regulator
LDSTQTYTESFRTHHKGPFNKKLFMDILVATNDPLQSDAIGSWFSQMEDAHCTEFTSCYLETLAICQEYRPKTIILGDGTHPNGQINWLAELSAVASPVQTSYIVLVRNISALEVALLVAKGVTVILHVCDSKQYFVLGRIFDHHTSVYLSPHLSKFFGLVPNGSHALHTLSHTELKIISLILQGHSTRQIASLLFRSWQTIEDHRKNIKRKLSIKGGKSELLNYVTPYTLWIVKIARENN